MDKVYLNIMKGLSKAFSTPHKKSKGTPVVKDQCPHGGDSTDCGSCAYYPDYEWNEEAGDCLRKEDDNE